MNQITITDLAKKLGLSVSTISRALNDHPDIKNSTKELVNKVAKKMGYEPNIMARNLKAQFSTQIGVIVPEIKHHFFAEVISGIEQVAYKEGFTVIVAQSNEDFEREKTNANSLYQNRIAGLLVSISQQTDNIEHLQLLVDKGVKLVAFDRVSPELKVPKVIVNDYKASIDAVNMLIKSKHKKIAHFAGPQNLLNCNYRKKGYLDALTSANIDVCKELISTGGMHEQDGINQAKFLVENHIDFDAIFAVNDPVAIGAMNYLKKKGYKIPTDVSIIGFSDNPIAEYVEPALTTVHQPAFEMGSSAAKKLIDLIKNKKEVEDELEILDANLIVRSSTK